MKLKKQLLRFLMSRLSTVDTDGGQWQGYRDANLATSEEDKTEALLKVSNARYEESKQYPIDVIFKTDFKKELRGKELLEIGSNNGGGSFYYFEQYHLKSITGIDVSTITAKTSKLFFKSKGVKSGYHFEKAFAENLPYDDASFDAILSFDVIEHVQDVQQALNECYRVLRPRGKAYMAFPSYYHPLGHHLNSVTKFPCVHWFFPPELIMDVYYDILEENPAYSSSLGESRRPLEHWEKLAIINGTTLSGFRSIIKKQSWTKSEHVSFPLGVHGSTFVNHPSLKILKYFTSFGTKFPVFREFCNHRIVYVLEK